MKDLFSLGHALFYIPLSHDRDTIALNRILLDTHLVVAGIIDKTILGRPKQISIKTLYSKQIRISLMKLNCSGNLYKTDTKVIATMGQSKRLQLLNVQTNIVSECIAGHLHAFDIVDYPLTQIPTLQYAVASPTSLVNTI